MHILGVAAKPEHQVSCLHHHLSQATTSMSQMRHCPSLGDMALQVWPCQMGVVDRGRWDGLCTTGTAISQNFVCRAAVNSSSNRVFSEQTCEHGLLCMDIQIRKHLPLAGLLLVNLHCWLGGKQTPKYKETAQALWSTYNFNLPTQPLLHLWPLLWLHSLSYLHSEWPRDYTPNISLICHWHFRGLLDRSCLHFP